MPMLPTDARSEWDPKLFDDPRVVSFWDERRLVGSWLSEQRSLGTDAYGPIVWDAFLLWGPDARWEKTPSAPASVGGPVIGESGKLTSALERLIGHPA